MTDKEKRQYIDKHLTEIYPQLRINCQKTLGMGFTKHGEDVLAVCIEFFLEKDIDVQYDSCVKNKAENFITYMMGLQSKSSSSRYYHHYRKPSLAGRELFDDYKYSVPSQDHWDPYHTSDDDYSLCIKEKVSDLDPFEKMVLEELIIEKNSMASVSEKYNIVFYQLKKTKEEVLSKLREECKRFLY